MLQAVKGHYKLYFKIIIFLNRVDIVLTQEPLQGFLKILGLTQVILRIPEGDYRSL